MTLVELFHKRPLKTIGVIGMGYVGIPSAILFADSESYDLVYGFQRDSNTSGYKIEMLNRGESPLKGEEPGLKQLLKKVTSSKKFICTSDFRELSECDAITLTIQTPFLNKKELIPSLEPLMEGLERVGKYITPGCLVVIESTVTPGTTTGFAREILERESGFTAGIEFGLAHAPERVMAGNLIYNIGHHDRIIGGIDKTSTERAVKLYKPILKSGKPITMSATAAEVTKTAENAFRDLQIAAVNELALYCEATGINIYDVRKGIDSLKGKGISREILYPGAGVGGHCLTKDTYHLERGVEMLGKGNLDYPPSEKSLFVVARQINDFMPVHMLHLTKSALNDLGVDLKETTIAILGWAYIADTDDARNTPSEPYRESLLLAGAKVTVHDPYVVGYGITDNLSDAIRGVDAIILFTAHKQYHTLDPETTKNLMGNKQPIIIDGRNVIDPDMFIRHEFIYRGVGRGDKNYG